MTNSKIDTQQDTQTETKETSQASNEPAQSEPARPESLQPVTIRAPVHCVRCGLSIDKAVIITTPVQALQKRYKVGSIIKPNDPFFDEIQKGTLKASTNAYGKACAKRWELDRQQSLLDVISGFHHDFTLSIGMSKKPLLEMFDLNGWFENHLPANSAAEFAENMKMFNLHWYGKPIKPGPYSEGEQDLQTRWRCFVDTLNKSWDFAMLAHWRTGNHSQLHFEVRLDSLHRLVLVSELDAVLELTPINLHLPDRQRIRWRR